MRMGKKINPTQEQHRISKTYLNAFSFRDQNQAIRISVLELGNSKIQHKHVKSFTKVVNLFDSALADPEFVRYFEKWSSKIETHYPKVLKSISETGILVDENRNHLIRFVSNLLIRQIRFREFFLIKIFEHHHTRKKLFNEISIFHSDPEESKKIWELIDPNLSAKEQLNLFAGEIWNHLMAALSRFTFVILKANPDTYWFTTDNPVIIDTRDNEEAWILPPQSEIYFPLSKDYLLFLYNERVPSDNPLRSYPANKVSQVSHDLQHTIIWDWIRTSAHQYIITGVDIGRIDLDA